MKNRHHFAALALAITLSLTAMPCLNVALAQQKQTAATTEAQKENSEAEKKSKAKKKPRKKKHIYTTPTVAKLSQLYWALGKFDGKNPEDIDNYIRINDCDIYKDYHHNEFEWAGIRESAKKFLLAEKKKFPLRFEFVQPIRFAEYDIKNKKFSIWDEYKFEGIRSMEILAKDMDQEICSLHKNTPNYPRGLYLELSRPFTLTEIPLSESEAKKFIAEKGEYFKRLQPHMQTQKTLYDLRDAYVVFKIKVINYKEDVATRDGYSLAKTLGNLETFEIYSDRDLKKLLYVEEVKPKKKQLSDKELELRAQYKERLQKKLAAEASHAATAPPAK